MNLKIFVTWLCVICLVIPALDAGRRERRTEYKKPIKNNTLRTPFAFMWTLEKEEVTTWEQKGKLLYMQGDTEGARDAYLESLRERPKNHKIWYDLGLAYFKMEEYLLAAHAFATANDLKSNVSYSYNACLAWHNGGDIKKAILGLRDLLEKHPDHGRGWKVLGRSYETIKQNQKALYCYQRAHALIPEDGELRLFADSFEDKDIQPRRVEALDRDKPAQLTDEPTFIKKQPRSLPVAKFLDENVYGDEQKIFPKDLSDLTTIYHLGSDAPQKTNLQPTELFKWSNLQHKIDHPQIELEDL